ncbi:MAG: serine/threonine protein kinase, partial [Deltaproteobacteria bacterium]|nr:serine/threonine protein kinase [Deltaproteobacteria bacterium]
MEESRESSTLIPGDVLGEKYRVVRKLGEGGMGAVFEAVNVKTTRRVAIKVLHPWVAADSQSVERFQREAQAATRLSHPNIVDVLDLDRDARTGSFYIVQEFLRGHDLFKHLEEKKRLSPQEAASLLVPVLAALALAHEKGIIHRDIKPENIFLVMTGGDPKPKLIDFGLAKVLEDDAKRIRTQTGAVMGTPYYMSPEQVRGVKDIDARADVWSMGAMLFELISGTLPFTDESTNMVMFKIMSEPTPRLDAACPDVDPSVADIVARAMDRDLDRRYRTMRDLLEAVLDCPAFQPPVALRERHRASIEHRPPDTSEDEDLHRASTLPAGAVGAAAPPSPRGSTGAFADAGGPAAKAPAADRGTDQVWQRAPSAAAPPAPSRRPLMVGLSAATLLLGAGVLWALQTHTPTPSPGVTAARPPAAAAPVPASAPTTPPPAALPTAAAAQTDGGGVAV